MYWSALPPYVQGNQHSCNMTAKVKRWEAAHSQYQNNSKCKKNINKIKPKNEIQFKRPPVIMLTHVHTKLMGSNCSSVWQLLLDFVYQTLWYMSWTVVLFDIVPSGSRLYFTSTGTHTLSNVMVIYTSERRLGKKVEYVVKSYTLQNAQI